MIEQILKAFNQNNITKYRINEVEAEQLELFFIRRKLDMRRGKKVHKYNVTVYRDFEKDGKKNLGSSEVELSESMKQDELNQKIKDAYFSASFVSNPYYELPSGTKEEFITLESGLSSLTLEEIAKKMTEALFAEDTQKDVFLNSAELFINRETCHIINSEGIDVGYKVNRVNGEFVAQCKEPQDVETYQNFAYDDLDTDALRTKVAETLNLTKARAQAIKAPAAGTYSVLLSGNSVKELISYYISRSGAGMIYPKYSNYQTGMMIQGEQITGEKLNLTLKAREPYSVEGISMKDRVLLEDSVLKTIHGTCRFSYYLNIEPTGNYRRYQMPAGSKSMEELKQGKYLHVINFSDFQMDSFTGHFGGEIRLAFLSDGTTITPVTGGSISGNILEAQKELVFSKELQKEKGFEGPYAVLLKDIKVAGC